MEVIIKLELTQVSIDLRCALAKELKDQNVLSLLAKDKNFGVREVVAYNLNTLQEDLKNEKAEKEVYKIEAKAYKEENAQLKKQKNNRRINEK